MKVHVELPPSKIVYENIKRVSYEYGHLSLETKHGEVLGLYNTYLCSFFEIQIEEEDDE